jgi:hypothetical protein
LSYRKNKISLDPHRFPAKTLSKSEDGLHNIEKLVCVSFSAFSVFKSL